jgi:hypothetical protein
MPEPPAMDTLTQRLVGGRLTAPGILEQRKLQSAQQRISVTSGSPLLARLMRRAQPAAPNSQQLLLARAIDSPERGEPLQPSTAAARPAFDGNGDSSSAAIRDPAPASSSAGGSSAGDRTAGGAPVVPRSGDIVAPRSAVPPLAARATVQRVVNRTEGTIARAVAALPFATGERSRPATPSSTPLAPAPPRVEPRAPGERVLFRKAESAVGERTNQAAMVAAEPAGLPLVTADVTHAPGIRRAPTSLVMRKPGGEAPMPLSIGTPVNPVTRVAAAAAPSLVFRKADAITHASSVSMAAPRVTVPVSGAATRGEIARPPAAPESQPSESVPPAVPTYPAAVDIDWITQQVSGRLARRLEIERERLGVRPWRPSN